jgi:HAE1 family hydrophobic/amphiphilic exporter-1
LLLRPSGQKHGRIFGVFNRFMKDTASGYTGMVKVLVRKITLAMLLFAAITMLAVLGFKSLPTGFLPDEDEGSIFVNARLPEGATLLRTEEVMNGIDAILANTPGVAEYVTVGGFSLLDGMSPNGAICFTNMEPWSKRQDPNLHVKKIAERLQGQLFAIPDAFCLALTPPSIMGLGMAGGFEVKIQDRGGAGLEALAQVGNDLVFQGMSDPVITRLNSTFRMSVPQLYVDIDRVKVKTLDVPLGSVFTALQTYLGSSYVNDFNLFGRTFKVIAQAEPLFRASAEDIGRLEVRNRSGQMVPIRTLATVRDSVGPQSVSHHNLYPCTTLTGVAKPGVSSGQAIERVRTLLDEKLPPSMGYEWSGISLQEIESGKSTVFIFLMAAIFAYLFLAAQYESWTIPVAIILAVPLGLLGAAVYTLLRGMDNNIYTQMGIVLLIGVVCKTAILLVEFAKQLHERPFGGGGRGGSGTDSLPSDPDDGADDSIGDAAAGDRHRRRGGRTAIAGNLGLWRNDRRDGGGRVYDSDFLCGRAAHQGKSRRNRTQDCRCRVPLAGVADKRVFGSSGQCVVWITEIKDSEI